MTVLAKVKFTLSDCPRWALLTDRGWTVIHDTGLAATLFNKITIPAADPDSPKPYDIAGNKQAIAQRLADLLGGTVELI
jgi:hypothetical protein